MSTQRPDVTSGDGASIDTTDTNTTPALPSVASLPVAPRRDDQNWAANVQRLTVEKRDGACGQKPVLFVARYAGRVTKARPPSRAFSAKSPSPESR